jgi:voltage-gated potassium channel Kch
MAVVSLVATGAYVAAGWSVADALYMVVVTVYTVGYGEVRPVDTPLLRSITIGTILLGCTGVIFLTGALVQFITLNEINQVFGVKRMTRQIETMTGHAIICGFGSIGALLAQGLQAARSSFVIIEQDGRRAEQARALGYPCVQADATDEAALQQAGIARARVLATVLSADAANVFITLSARKLNPALDIIARGEAPSTESKLQQAGANRVVLPTHIGAERMVEMILYQETERFIRGSERMRAFEKTLLSLGLNLEVVVAAPGSPVVGQTIEAVEREASGAFFIVQINDQTGTDVVTRPAPDTRIKSGDGVLLVSRGTRAHTLFKAGDRSTFRKSAR